MSAVDDRGKLRGYTVGPHAGKPTVLSVRLGATESRLAPVVDVIEQHADDGEHLAAQVAVPHGDALGYALVIESRQSKVLRSLAVLLGEAADKLDEKHAARRPQPKPGPVGYVDQTQQPAS